MNPIHMPLLLLAAASSSVAVQAADPSGEETKTGLVLSVDTSFSATSSGDLKSSSFKYGELSSREASVSISGEVGLGEADRLGVGVSGDGIYFDHDVLTLVPISGTEGTYYLNDTSSLPERLQRVSLDLTWSHRFDDRWSSLIVASPGLRWADSGCSSDAFGVSGLAGVQYSSSPELSWLFGIAFDTMSHDYSVVPAVGLTWKPAAEWSVSVGFPKTAIVYNVTPAFSLGLVGEGKGGAYHVKRDPWHSLPLGASNVLDDSEFEYVDVRLGLQAGYALSERCTLTGTIGSVLYREGQYHKSHVKMSKIKSDEASLYGSVGLKVAF